MCKRIHDAPVHLALDGITRSGRLRIGSQRHSTNSGSWRRRLRILISLSSPMNLSAYHFLRLPADNALPGVLHKSGASVIVSHSESRAFPTDVMLFPPGSRQSPASPAACRLPMCGDAGRAHRQGETPGPAGTAELPGGNQHHVGGKARRNSPSGSITTCRRML